MKQGDLFSDLNQEPSPKERDPQSPADPPAALPTSTPPAASTPPPTPTPTPTPPPLPATRTRTRTTPPRPDADSRQLAVTCFDRPLLLEAGAGTGKTATLVARVLHWCLGPGWNEARTDRPDANPERLALGVLRGVAAITFTEAAAAEMSTRVGRALSRIQRAASSGSLDAADLPPGVRLDVLPREPAEVLLRARALRAALDHLEVSTIHAFCRRLLATYPLEAGFDPGFEVDPTFTQVEVTAREVLEETVREAWSDPVDVDWIELAARGVDAPRVEAAVIELIDAGARAADFAVDPLGPEVAGGLCGRLREAVLEFHTLSRPLVNASGVTGDALEGFERVAAEVARHAGGSSGDFAALCSALNGICTDTANVWKRIKDWGRPKFTKGDERVLGADVAAFSAAALELRHALEPFRELDVELLTRARPIIHSILARVEAELRRRGIATFTDLLVEAQRLLVEHPEIARIERGRRRQLLVDEFQDTDAVQCDVVAAIGLAPAGETGPTLFLVGDPKQSIFAWRSADLLAYEDLAQRVVDAGGERLALTCNFRSLAPILDEVTRVIEPVMVEVRGVQPDFVALEAARSTPADETARVEYWVSWARDDERVVPAEPKPLARGYEIEARALAADVRRRHDRDGDAWKGFAVVFRALTQIEPYLEELRRLGVPYEVQSDRKYYRRREVVDTTALVRAVLDPNDQLALVTLLRSPMVGVPDAALMPLWQAGFPGRMASLHSANEERLAEVVQLVREAAALVPRDVPGLEEIGAWEESLVAAVESLACLRTAFREEPADRWVELMREAFLPEAFEAARYLGAYRLANLERFFRDLLGALEARGGDMHAVLRTLRSNLAREDRTEAARPSDSDQDAVQILTIHGAKGLEFRHVYLAQSHRIDRGRGAWEPNAFDRRGGAVAYRLFNAPTPSWFAAQLRRKEAEAAERVRLLYVALTRAADRLVVMGAWPPEVEGRRKGWSDATRSLDLLRWRAGAPRAIAELAQRTKSGESVGVYRDEWGADWRLALEVEPLVPIAGTGAGTDSSSAACQPTPPEVVAQEALSLAQARLAAAARAARPYQSTASAEAHAGAAEGVAERRFRSDETHTTPAIGRDAAKAIGTAVHRALEHFDPALDADGLERHSAELEAFLRESVAPASFDDSLARARDLLTRVQTNGILGRLQEVWDSVVARELPVLTPPPNTDESAVGFVAGAIDLLYRDPGTSEWVVADYKTDIVANADDLRARTDAYQGQGRAYVTAVRSALELDADPRFELWFLHSGDVVVTGGA